MFYTANIFKKELGYLTDEQLRHVTRVANDVIAKQGTLVWGRSLNDGSMYDFSTKKGSSDLSVGILIGVKEMGIFKEDHAPIRRDMPVELQGEAKDAFIEQQRRELVAAREVIKRRGEKL